jgi:CRP-like cAMP-binding protein
LPDDVRASVKKQIAHKQIDRGEQLFHEGEAPAGIWMLCAGKVKIMRQAPDGKPLITRVILPGDIFGQRAYFAGQPYQASAEAMEPSVLSFLERDLVDRLVKKYGDFAAFMLRRLAVDLDRAESMATNMAYRGARDRVLDVLYDIHLKSQLVGDEAWQFSIRRQDLAELAGLTVETIVRVLKALEKEGFLQIEGRQISVVDSKKLLEQVRASLFTES